MKDWQKSLCRSNDKFEIIARILNESASKIVFVVDEDSTLLGTITDGDIRRGILRSGFQLVASEIMQLNFKSVPEDMPYEQVKLFMLKWSIQRVPVLDALGKIRDVISLEDTLKAEELEDVLVVIMAGGKGERLQPLTSHKPKPLIEVKGKPLIEYVIEGCIKSGMRDIIVSVNYLRQQIIDRIGDGKTYGCRITYIEESAPLGTAGSLSLIADATKKKILVINADVLTNLNYKNLYSFHRSLNADVTVGVRRYYHRIPFGVIEARGSVLTGIKEKPQIEELVSAGIYLIEGKVLSLLQSERVDMPDFIEACLSDEKKIFAFPLHEEWLDVGTHEVLEKVNKLL